MAARIAVRERLWTEFSKKVRFAPTVNASLPEGRRRSWTTVVEPESFCGRPHSGSIGRMPSADVERRQRLRTAAGSFCSEVSQPAEHRNRFRTESSVGMPISPWNFDGMKAGCGGTGAATQAMLGLPIASWTSFDGMPAWDNTGTEMEAPMFWPFSQWNFTDDILACESAGFDAGMSAMHFLVAPPAQPESLLATIAPPITYSYQKAQPSLEEQQVSAKTADAKQTQTIQLSSLLDLAPVAEIPPAQASSAGSDKTTVMLRNLPSGFTRRMLIGLLDSQGFAGRYDFAYIPCNFETLTSLSHAFVNMVEPADAERLRDDLEGFSNWAMPSDSVCHIVWNDKHQGLAELVERYRNSPVMHEDIPEECKPMILCNGERVKFPMPTQRIKAPKMSKAKA